MTNGGIEKARRVDDHDPERSLRVHCRQMGLMAGVGVQGSKITRIAPDR